MPQYLDRLPIAIPDKEAKVRLTEIAQQAMKIGYEAVKPNLNTIVYRLYSVKEEEIALVGP